MYSQAAPLIEEGRKLQRELKEKQNHLSKLSKGEAKEQRSLSFLDAYRVTSHLKDSITTVQISSDVPIIIGATLFAQTNGGGTLVVCLQQFRAQALTAFSLGVKRYSLRLIGSRLTRNKHDTPIIIVIISFPLGVGGGAYVCLYQENKTVLT